MNKKLIGWAAYVSILAGIVAYNWLTTPMELIGEKLHFNKYDNGVVILAEGKYKNALGWEIEKKRVGVITKDWKALSSKWAKTEWGARRLEEKAIKSLEEVNLETRAQ